MNTLKVKSQNITDLLGEVIFTSRNGNDFEAFIHGKEITNQTVNVTFASLDYDLDWSVVFSENKLKRKKLVKENDYCSYQAYGQILSINPTIVDFGDIVMEIGLHTNDENVIGDYIYWMIARLDVLDISFA